MDIETIIIQAKRAADEHYDAYYGYQQTPQQRNRSGEAIHRIRKIAETLPADQREQVEAILAEGREREAEAKARKQKAIDEWRAARESN